MKDIISDPQLVAFCGLYCGACGKYRKGSCPGCRENEKASWCKIRACGIENEHATCADCTEFADVSDCGKFNNVISKIFALVFRSNRRACIGRIKEAGVNTYADEMAAAGMQSLKR